MADPVPSAQTAAAPPRLAPWLLVYTLGRLVIAAALVAMLWAAGVGSFPGLLFGLLLSMPVSYVALRPVRDKLTLAMLARRDRRTAAKQELRARLSGAATERPATE